MAGSKNWNSSVCDVIKNYWRTPLSKESASDIIKYVNYHTCYVRVHKKY